MKKFVSVLLSTVLLCFTLLGTTAFAEENFKLSLTLPEECKTNDTAYLTVKIDAIQKNMLFAILSVEFSGLEFETEKDIQIKNIEAKNIDSSVIDFCRLTGDGCLEIVLDGSKSEIPSGAEFILKAKVKNVQSIDVKIDTSGSFATSGDNDSHPEPFELNVINTDYNNDTSEASQPNDDSSVSDENSFEESVGGAVSEAENTSDTESQNVDADNSNGVSDASEDASDADANDGGTTLLIIGICIFAVTALGLGILVKNRK